MDLTKRRAELQEQIKQATAELDRLRAVILRMQGAIALIDEQLADESEG